MRAFALVSLVHFLATTASAATIPSFFRNGDRLARGVEEGRGNAIPVGRRSPNKQRLVRRRKHHDWHDWNDNNNRPSSSSSGCGDGNTATTETDSPAQTWNSTSTPAWTPTSSNDVPRPTDSTSSSDAPYPTDSSTSSDAPYPTDSSTSSDAPYPTDSSTSSGFPLPTDSSTSSDSPFPTDSTTTDGPSSSSSSTSSSESASPSPSATGGGGGNIPDSEWTLSRSIVGRDFFNEDHWNFWDYPDPTHGEVDYVNRATAFSNNLASYDSDGDAIMRVEDTKVVNGPRQSIRLHSVFTWDGGMVIMDAKHMPTGCGTWPAWWQNGPDWPYGGEIDILEGVNNGKVNQVSLHTGPGCRAPSNAESQMTGKFARGNWDSHDCGSAATANQGCGVVDEGNTAGYGEGFNANNGGVYVLKWDQSGLAVWFHSRNNIPADITAEKPNPNNWGTPVARWPAADCDPFEYFKQHISIWDTTLCGDWAGADGVWQSGGCAASTGYNTCLDYIHNNGDALKEAYWKVSYVKYFQSPTSHP